MNKLINFILKYKILILVVVVVSVILFVSSRPRQSISPSGPNSPQSVDLKLVKPGTTTEKDVIDQLGEPLSLSEQDTKKILEYKSTSPVRRHQIDVENDKAVFVKEIVSTKDAKKAQGIKNEYGEPDYTLFDQQSPDSGFSLYVYPGQGLAYWGHQVDGTLLEVWYFSPTTLQEFINKWAPNWSTEEAPHTQE